jgi:hypothetical protein
MNKGFLFGNRLIGWYSINTVMKLRDNFHARGWCLSKADTVIEKSIIQHVSSGWEGETFDA